MSTWEHWRAHHFFLIDENQNIKWCKKYGRISNSSHCKQSSPITEAGEKVGWSKWSRPVEATPMIEDLVLRKPNLATAETPLQHFTVPYCTVVLHWCRHLLTAHMHANPATLPRGLFFWYPSWLRLSSDSLINRSITHNPSSSSSIPTHQHFSSAFLYTSAAMLRLYDSSQSFKLWAHNIPPLSAHISMHALHQWH